MFVFLRYGRLAPHYTATHCNTLQHTATHCNITHHYARLAPSPFPSTGILSTSGVTVVCIFWLGVMTRRVLAIPATSAALERLFSTAGNVMTKKRWRLTCDNMEELVYLHEIWQQARKWEAVKKMRLEWFVLNEWNTLPSMSSLFYIYISINIYVHICNL